MSYHTAVNAVKNVGFKLDQDAVSMADPMLDIIG